MKLYPKAEAQDWVLLRMLKLSLEANPKLSLHHEYVKCVLYLNKKLGMAQFLDMCDMLHAEKRGEVK